MKKVDGMIPPTFVLADDGKKGERGPVPSFSMASGGTSGLTMPYLSCHARFAITLMTTGIAMAATSSAALAMATRRPRADAARGAYARAQAASASADTIAR